MQRFYPYRLTVLAEAVSRMVSGVYRQRYGLSRQAWRVMVALANRPDATATDVADYSTLDKMQVSRAVAELETRDLVSRSEGEHDRRTKTLRLTPSGRRLFDDLVPLVVERERQLLAVLDAEERAALDRALAKLLAQARSFSPDRDED
jgi:DNA-binding MarR family transcriptional regulator